MKIPLSLLAAAAATALALRAPAADAQFDAFVNATTADWVRHNPQLATDKQFFTGAEQDALDRQLTPATREFVQQNADRARTALAALKRFDRASLDASQRVSAAMLQWHLEEAINDAKFADFNYPLNQFTGAQTNVVTFLSNAHPIRRVRDAENYLARVEQIPALIDTLITEARRLEQRGIVPPKFILESTIAQMERLIAPAPTDNILVSSLAARAATVADFPAADRERLVSATATVVREQVYPAYRRGIAFLQGQLPRASDAAGLSQFPGGAEAYAWFLRKYTTTDYTPEQVHALGLQQVALIEREMDALFQQLALHEGTVAERIAALNLRHQPPGSEDEARAYMLRRYEEVIRDAERRCAELFDLRPRAPVVVQREPLFTEKNAAAHYTEPSRDGTRPGIFWAPLPKAPFPLVPLRSLAYHEAVPGHHFQIALQLEQTDLPRFRSDAVFGFLSAHGEGWALYAERLAAEQGWYEGDPVGRIGQLASALFRAKRLVADTGLHMKGWTRQQAIDYGLPASEVERYVVWAGQACSYKIGELKIVELREKARQALGAKFSLKEFHNLVLRTGGVPLAVLEQLVDDWIAERK